jgi:hypothetical protein
MQLHMQELPEQEEWQKFEEEVQKYEVQMCDSFIHLHTNYSWSLLTHILNYFIWKIWSPENNY